MIYKLNNNSAIEVKVFDTFDELAKLTLLATQKGAVALSGGSTYDKLFESWATTSGFGIDATFFPVDERCVPQEHRDSNWGNACTKLFTPLGIEGQCKNGAHSLDTYCEVLAAYFSSEEFLFDAIFLGVGDDGHTASLFPGDVNSLKSDENVLATLSPKGIKERITLGPKVLSSAQELIMVIAGEGKSACIEWLLNKDHSYPFVEVLSRNANTTLYLHRPLYDRFANNA